ncbi:MAG: GNVR domain-containing protein [Burkholderiaceae bacterium]
MIDTLIAIGQEKKTIFWMAFICTLVGLVISLLMTNIYTAKTTFLPPQQNQGGAASALAALGGLGGLAGGALGIKSPDELYVAFLNSETVQNNLIRQFQLQDRYEKKTLIDTRKAFSGNIKITSEKKTGLITIEVDDKSSEFSAKLANAYFDELRRLLDHLAVTEAQQRRVFFEKLIVKTKEALSLAELSAKKAQETSGIVSLDAQTTASIKISAELRAQIALREVQIRAMSSYATPQNGDMQRLEAELAGLRGQLNKLEQGNNQTLSEDKSGGALANLRAFREVKYQEAVLDMLVKQYELARVEEAKEGPLIQQVDVATVPERKSKPKRAIITILSAIGGLLLAFLIVFVRRGMRKAELDPALAESLQTMREVWGLKARHK